MRNMHCKSPAIFALNTIFSSFFIVAGSWTFLSSARAASSSSRMSRSSPSALLHTDDRWPQESPLQRTVLFVFGLLNHVNVCLCESASSVMQSVLAVAGMSLVTMAVVGATASIFSRTSFKRWALAGVVLEAAAFVLFVLRDATEGGIGFKTLALFSLVLTTALVFFVGEGTLYFQEKVFFHRIFSVNSFKSPRRPHAALY